MRIKEAMQSAPELSQEHPTTIVLTDEILDNQPNTRDPYEVDVGHKELVEDETNENE